MLVKQIEEYNAKHLNQRGLEYPLTHRSVSLTYQLLDSEDLIEHMEEKIQYYKQQLNAVRNSKLSPAEKGKWGRFWWDRIQRLQESKQKEEDRVLELRSEIAEEHKKKQRDR
jgi:dTDP-4-amino-4,6-dideoxygalactose transaminase